MNPVDIDAIYDAVINCVRGEVFFTGISGITDLSIELNHGVNGNRNTLASLNIPTYLVESNKFCFSFPAPMYNENLAVKVNVTHSSGSNMLEEGVVAADVKEELVIGQFETSDAAATDGDIDDLPPYTYDDEDPLHRSHHDGRFVYDQGPPAEKETQVCKEAPFVNLDFTTNDILRTGTGLTYTGGAYRMLLNYDGLFIQQTENEIVLNAPRYIEPSVTNLIDSTLNVSLSGQLPTGWDISTYGVYYGDIIQETSFAKLFELSLYNPNSEAAILFLNSNALNSSEPVTFSCWVNVIGIGSEVSGTLVTAINFYDASNVLVGSKEITPRTLEVGWGFTSISVPSAMIPPLATSMRPRFTITADYDVMLKFFVPNVTQYFKPTTSIIGANTRTADVWNVTVDDCITSDSLQIEAVFNNNAWDTSYYLTEFVVGSQNLTYLYSSGAFTLFLDNGSTSLTAVSEVLSSVNWLNSVLDKDTVDPPTDPTTGDRYLLLRGGTGAWIGHESDIAEWNGVSWDFTTPSKCQCVVVTDESQSYVFNDPTWETIDLDEDDFRCVASYNYENDTVEMSLNNVALSVTKPSVVPEMDLSNALVYVGTDAAGLNALGGIIEKFIVRRGS